jgi:hypothetical protein
VKPLPLLALPILGPGGAVVGDVDPATLLAERPLPVAQADVTDAAALSTVARATACWLVAHPDDPALPRVQGAFGVDRDDVVRTLALVAAATPEQLRDDAWLDAHLRALAWSPDLAAARARGVSPPSDRIRLTRYLVYEVDGSAVRTSARDTALWAVPDDETGLSPADADARRATLRRFRYTRKQVLDGIYDVGGAEEGRATPLVWLARADVHRALMQGTVQVRLPDGTIRLYNVDRNNGIVYDPAIKDPERQDRFWYFTQVDGLMGYGPSGDRVRVEPRVTVAGDVLDLGLGSLVALHWGTARQLAVLADTGGAFQPNLFQLDWLAGTYPSHEAFLADTNEVPAYVGASFLVLRDGVTAPPLECPR